MKELMVWCTAAEVNQKYYFAKVERWYKMVHEIFGMNAYFMVYVDGAVVEPTNPNIHYISITPKLGRLSVWQFPGWKRSFGRALDTANKSGFKFCVHIENDFYIPKRSYGLVEELAYTEGCFSAWDHNYEFVEPAFMVLNDAAIREKYAKYYTITKNLMENIDFEERLKNSGDFTPKLDSYRLENCTMDDVPNYQAYAQFK